MFWEPPFMGWGSLANPPALQLTRRVDLPAGGWLGCPQRLPQIGASDTEQMECSDEETHL